MSAFSAAMAALLADANFGAAAVWRSGGSGPPLSIRVLRSQPDAKSSGFGTTVLQATDILSVAVADLPELSSGDTFEVDTLTLIVQYAERDASGTVWRVFCKR